MEPKFWWVWVVAGILLIVLEIFTVGFIVMWFGIAAIITAIPVYLGSSIEIIVATYGLSVLLLTVFVRRISLDYMSPTSKALNTNADDVLNSSGIVVEEIDPIKGKGQVRVRREVWTASSQNGVNLPVDTVVRVLKVEGVKLIVTKEKE